MHSWERMVQRVALGAILLLSFFLDFFRLGQNGYGNLYYAAGVRSMADSWHTFFFVSFDPGGFVTIDKPPLGFWLQTLSTKLFGFTPFSLFLPQALCGFCTVWLLYILVRRHFGVVAGLLAALALVITPISVVTDRNNTTDGTLALVLLLAAWAVIHAAETGKLRWLLVSSVWVGLGFNVKMTEAYLIVPALGLTYFLCAPGSLWRRIWHLSLALLVVILLSLSWIALVDMIPASQRPYVGSTQNNSEIQLAFGYNGLNRLHLGPSSTSGQATAMSRSETINASDSFSVFHTNTIGPLHLFNANLGGQIAWLLPLALFGMVALAWQRRWRLQDDRQQLGLVLWGGWFLTMFIFFSMSSLFQAYYMVEMAPGLSALVGIGLVIMWEDYRVAGWRGWLLPLALAVTAVVQIHLLAHYPFYGRQISPWIGAITLIAVLVLLVFRLRPSLSIDRLGGRFLVTGIIVCLQCLALFLSPGIWSGYSVLYNLETPFPSAGPNPHASVLTFTRIKHALEVKSLSITDATDIKPFAGLSIYLQRHQGKTLFFVATPSTGVADSLILSLNKPVMALGGFSGKDPIMTVSHLETLIKMNSVRFFIVNNRQATTISNWVAHACTVVPTMQWNHTRTSLFGLFDCAFPPMQHVKTHPIKIYHLPRFVKEI